MSNEVDRTMWVGNLSENITEDILYELFLQAGPLQSVKIAKEKDGRQKNFAFITFEHDVSVPYTINLMDGMPVYGRSLRLQSRPGSIHQQQQQQQPNMAQGRSNMNNPYSNNQPNRDNYSNRNSNNLPPNPYGNQPIRSQGSPMSHPPHFHRSNTWHGDGQQERDRNGRESQYRDRGGARGQDRDRSSSRNRDDDERGMSRREDYGNSNNNGSSDHEAKRQKVLRKQEEVLDRYRQQGQKRSRDSPQPQPWQSQRRGRY